MIALALNKAASEAANKATIATAKELRRAYDYDLRCDNNCGLCYPKGELCSICKKIRKDHPYYISDIMYKALMAGWKTATTIINNLES